MNDIELWQGDCLELMKSIEDKSIDCIICDLPYGTISCAWDVIIPFDKLWEQYNRIIIGAPQKDICCRNDRQERKCKNICCAVVGKEIDYFNKDRNARFIQRFDFLPDISAEHLIGLVICIEIGTDFITEASGKNQRNYRSDQQCRSNLRSRLRLQKATACINSSGGLCSRAENHH